MTSDQGNFPVSNETMMDKMPLNPTTHDIVMSEPETMQVEEIIEDEFDLHVCGKCKAEFTNIQLYVDHKRLVCSKQSTNKTPDLSSKDRKIEHSPPKHVINGTESVTTILEPHVQGFCETIIEDSGIVVEAQETGTQQEIIKAASASEHPPVEVDKEMKENSVQPQPTVIDASNLTPDENGIYKCGVCPKEFDQGNSMVVHQYIHKKFHQCCDCKRSFVSLENLNKHKREFKHVFKCRICEVEFPNQETCKKHKAEHFRQHECIDCKKSFYTEKSLLRHREKVLHNLPCPECGKICRDKHALSKHRESHLQVKSHTCDWENCDRGFRSASELLKHKKCVHLGIKEHKCQECGREFARKDKLNRHMLIHSPNRPTFACPFKSFTGCQKTFYRKDKLQRHIFAHSKEKPFKCETCHKVFARKDNLNEHMRIHTGDFKHRCPVCNKGLGGPKKLFLHMQQKHSGVNEVIPDKPTMVSESVLLATSQAASVIPAATTMVASTQSADDSAAASWVQENITGENKTTENANVGKGTVTTENASGIAEGYQREGDTADTTDYQTIVEEESSRVSNYPSNQQEVEHPPVGDHEDYQHEPEVIHPSEVSEPTVQQPTVEQSAILHQQAIQIEPSQNTLQVAIQPMIEQAEVHDEPQQIVIQAQAMVIPQNQGSPPRVSVHYLSSNTTSQPQDSYVPAINQASVSQSDSALLHEVLSELATRSLFNA